jgi:hypothetical protein
MKNVMTDFTWAMKEREHLNMTARFVACIVGTITRRLRYQHVGFEKSLSQLSAPRFHIS